MSSINNIRASAGQVSHLIRGRSKGNLQSARTKPVNSPTLPLLWTTRIAAGNGHAVITQQRATVSYMSDATKLQIPRGLFVAPTNGPPTAVESVLGIIEAIDFRLKGALLDAQHQYADLDIGYAVADPDSTKHQIWAGPITDWDTVAPVAADGTAQSRFITISLLEGNVTEDGDFSALNDRDKERSLFLTLRYGPADDDLYWFPAPLDINQDTPQAAETLDKLPILKQQLSDYLSAAFELNFSAIDAGMLLLDTNRYRDDQWKDVASLDSFRTRLTSYSLSMVAALNMPAVGGDVQLAHARAYCLAMGFLPTPTSLHSAEYQVTDFLPEMTELQSVVDDLAMSDDHSVYPRRAMSLLAAFGALHMANDHTYRRSDNDLKRKGVSYVQALRTVFPEDCIRRFATEGALEAVVRTTCHCFGLASGWGAFKQGQSLEVLAEPLMVRDSVVPPPIAKVGLIVSAMGKAMSLPIGDLIRTNYGSQVTALEALRKTVVAEAAAYSELHKHYGIADVKKLTQEQEEMCKSLLPFVTAYVMTFDRDSQGNAMGAALSQIVRKCHDEQAGLVSLYITAFENYVENAPSLGTLLAPATAKPAAN